MGPSPAANVLWPTGADFAPGGGSYTDQRLPRSGILVTTVVKIGASYTHQNSFHELEPLVSEKKYPELLLTRSMTVDRLLVYGGRRLKSKKKDLKCGPTVVKNKRAINRDIADYVTLASNTIPAAS